MKSTCACKMGSRRTLKIEFLGFHDTRIADVTINVDDYDAGIPSSFNFTVVGQCSMNLQSLAVVDNVGEFSI